MYKRGVTVVYRISVRHLCTETFVYKRGVTVV